MLDFKQAHTLLRNFFADGKRETAKRKTVIIPYDGSSDFVYFVVEGYVKVVSHSESGAERIHYLYGPNDFFPVSSLLHDMRLRIEFVAFTDVKLVKKPAADIKRLFESTPSCLLAVLDQQSSTYSRIINLNMGSAERRVAYRIQTLSQRFGKKVNDHFVIEIPVTLQDIANMVRLTRESVGKIMAELEHKDCVHMGRRNIIVYPKRLRQFSEE